MARAIEAGVPKMRIEEAAARAQARIDWLAWAMSSRASSAGCSTSSGGLEARRREQRSRWLRTLIDERLRALLAGSPAAAAALARAESEVRASTTTPAAAAALVIGAFLGEVGETGPN